jgi:hypothetical protein
MVKEVVYIVSFAVSIDENIEAFAVSEKSGIRQINLITSRFCSPGRKLIAASCNLHLLFTPERIHRSGSQVNPFHEVVIRIQPDTSRIEYRTKVSDLAIGLLTRQLGAGSQAKRSAYVQADPDDVICLAARPSPVQVPTAHAALSSTKYTTDKWICKFCRCSINSAPMLSNDVGVSPTNYCRSREALRQAPHNAI